MATQSTATGSSKQLRYAGDINVAEVTITSLITNKKFNVANQLVTIQIFEDMFSPFISGSLIFQESLDFASNFPFVGEEVIDLKLFTPTLDESKPKTGVIQGRFYIYKMADREIMAERSMVYQLHFIAIEAIADINTKISKGYDGLISDIAKTLIKGEDELSSDKEILIEETSNKLKFVSNFWSPVRNINYLLKHAQNKGKSPTYVFYESRYGYNFVSLDTLNSQEPIQYFLNNNSTDSVSPSGGSKRNFENDYRRIAEMNIPISHDYMDRVTHGAYGSTMLFMDLAKKEYFNLKHSFLKDWGKAGEETRLNKYPVTSNKVYTTYRASMYNDVMENGLFTDYDDVSDVRVRQKRVSRLKQAEAYKINITVAGRTDYTVGQKVNVKSYKAEPIKGSDADEDILDNIISGNYLIATINHVIDREKHECHMQLIKDSLTINLDKGATK
jgi:hypothetical protein